MPQEVVGFNIDAFRTAIAGKGLLKQNKFMVWFPLPSGIVNNSVALPFMDGVAREINMWCDASEIPSVVTQLQNFRRYGYGPFERRPTTQVFSDITLSFIVDAKANIWYFFKHWSNLVANFEARDGITTSASGFAGNNPYDPYEIGFKDDYATNMILSVFNDAGDEVLRIILKEAFPIGMGSIRTDWAAEGVSKLQVTFSFLDWYTETEGLKHAPASQVVDSSSPLQFFGPISQPVSQSFNTTATRNIS